MENVLKLIIKIATALCTLALFVMATWSLISNIHPLLTIVGFMLCAVFGFFTYTDVKGFLAAKALKK